MHVICIVICGIVVADADCFAQRRKLKHEEGGAGPSAGHAGGAGPSNAGHQDAPVPYGGTAVSAGGEQSGGGSSDDDDAFKAE